MTEAIRGFQGEYRFLSNFYPSPIRVTFTGIEYLFPTAEHLYQASKLIYTELSTDDQREIVEQIISSTPGQAKRIGRGIPLTDQWDDVESDIVMREVIGEKFEQNPDLAQRLLGTGTAYLEEANNWGDNKWGTVNGFGQNLLGWILMDERDHWWAESLRTTATPPLEVTEWHEIPGAVHGQWRNLPIPAFGRTLNSEDSGSSGANGG